MNKTPSEAKALVKELAPLVANDEADVVFCVPAIAKREPGHPGRNQEYHHMVSWPRL